MSSFASLRIILYHRWVPLFPAKNPYSGVISKSECRNHSSLSTAIGSYSYCSKLNCAGKSATIDRWNSETSPHLRRSSEGYKIIRCWINTAYADEGESTISYQGRVSPHYHWTKRRLTDLSHFTMLFDTSPPVLKRLEGTLRADPLVVRWTTLKKGEAM